MHSLPLVGPRYPSASKLSSAAICVAPWSLGLPREKDDSPDAARGRLLHAGAEALAKGATGGAITAEHLAAGMPFEEANRLRNVLAHVQDLLAADVEAWAYGKPWLVEQGVLWRSVDGLDEAQLVQRAPGEEAVGWFSGTADLVYVRHDGVLVVVDWKFGPRQRWTSERAENHWQGWSLALYLCTALGVSAARGVDVVARFEARYVDEEGAWVDGHDITQGELDAHAVELGRLAARIESGEGPRVGAACGSCKARAACPTYAAIGEQAAAALVPSSPSALWAPPRTEDEARLLHYRIGAVETWLGRAREYRRAYVLTHAPVQLGAGQELAAVGRTRRGVVKTPEALAIVEEVAGPAAVETVTTRKATVASIRDAARAVGEDVKSASDRKKLKDATEERVFGELAARGAVQEKGAVYAIGVRRSDGTVVEVVDRIAEEDE